MHGDAIGAAQMGLDGGPDRIGFVGLARFTHRRHVINVYAKFNHACSTEAPKDGL
jgi:hypothetical protein